MISSRAAWFWLPVLAIFIARPAFGGELLPMDDYEPPPFMFDDPPAQTNAAAGFLTAIEGAEEPKAEKPRPKPPKKPQAPMKLEKKARPKIDRVLASVPDKPRAKAPPKPIVKIPSKTQLEDGQRLVNPNARDILASIEGMESARNTGGKVTLTFMPGETALNLDMKNRLLSDYVPELRKNGESRAEIHAFASSAGGGETGARRVSLARAIEVQDFLAAAGVAEARIDVMPLGNQTDSGPADRVDLVIKPRK